MAGGREGGRAGRNERREAGRQGGREAGRQAGRERDHGVSTGVRSRAGQQLLRTFHCDDVMMSSSSASLTPERFRV